MVKPSSTKQTAIDDVDKDSETDKDVSYREDADITINSSILSSTNHDYVPDVSYNPGSMEMDGTYYQNMKMVLMCNEIEEPKDLISNKSYDSCKPTIRSVV